MTKTGVRRIRRRRTRKPDNGSIFAALGGSVVATAAERQPEPRPVDQLLKHFVLLLLGGAIANELGGPQRAKAFVNGYAETLKQRSESPALAA